MSIKNYFKDKSFWGLLLAWSFLGAIALVVVLVPIFALWQNMPDALFDLLGKIAEWGLMILIIIFVISSGMRKAEIVNSLEVVPEGEQKKKEKYVNPFPEETKRYYRRWGWIGLISLLLFFVLAVVLFVLYLFSGFSSTILFIIDWGLIIMGCVGIGIYLKGDAKGVFFKSTEEEETK